MTDLFLKAQPNGSLLPTTRAGEDYVRSLKAFEVIKCKPSRPRNWRHHNKFFALLEIVLPNTEYRTVEQLRKVLAVHIGHCDFIESRGKLVAIPKSISFDKMDQSEFEVFYRATLDAVCEHIIPGMDRVALENEVRQST